ncbi:MAG: hypothetical protein AABZ29_09425 [Gemmatimonadota bacterium]
MLRRFYALALPLAVLATPFPASVRAQAPGAPIGGPIGAPAGAQPALKPPITPRRAFLYSLFVPGAGQAALDRQFVGGVFFLTEGLSLALVHRSAEDLRLARQFRNDSLPATYQVDAGGQAVVGADGRPVVATWNVSRYSAARVRARRTHYEDWLAVLIFNHLFSGADAFVAAQLWDLPARVAVRTAPDGRAAVVATLRFR